MMKVKRSHSFGQRVKQVVCQEQLEFIGKHVKGQSELSSMFCNKLVASLLSRKALGHWNYFNCSSVFCFHLHLSSKCFDSLILFFLVKGFTLRSTSELFAFPWITLCWRNHLKSFRYSLIHKLISLKKARSFWMRESWEDFYRSILFHRRSSSFLTFELVKRRGNFSIQVFNYSSLIHASKILWKHWRNLLCQVYLNTYIVHRNFKRFYKVHSVRICFRYVVKLSLYLTPMRELSHFLLKAWKKISFCLSGHERH